MRLTWKYRLLVGSIAVVSVMSAGWQSRPLHTPAGKPESKSPHAKNLHAFKTAQPITFVENVGQFDEAATFQAQIHGQSIWLTDREIVFDAVHDALNRTKLALAGDSNVGKQETAPDSNIFRE